MSSGQQIITTFIIAIIAIALVNRVPPLRRIVGGF